MISSIRFLLPHDSGQDKELCWICELLDQIETFWEVVKNSHDWTARGWKTQIEVGDLVLLMQS